MALLSKWSFEAKGPSPQISAPNGKTPSNGEGTLIKRIKFGFDSMCSFREIGTTELFSAKNIPVFTRLDEITLEESIQRIVRSTVFEV
jgi:hypothetical protein